MASKPQRLSAIELADVRRRARRLEVLHKRLEALHDELRVITDQVLESTRRLHAEMQQTRSSAPAMSSAPKIAAK